MTFVKRNLCMACFDKLEADIKSISSKSHCVFQQVFMKVNIKVVKMM